GAPRRRRLEGLLRRVEDPGHDPELPGRQDPDEVGGDVARHGVILLAKDHRQPPAVVGMPLPEPVTQIRFRSDDQESQVLDALRPPDPYRVVVEIGGDDGAARRLLTAENPGRGTDAPPARACAGEGLAFGLAALDDATGGAGGGTGPAPP